MSSNNKRPKSVPKITTIKEHMDLMDQIKNPKTKVKRKKK